MMLDNDPFSWFFWLLCLEMRRLSLHLHMVGALLQLRVEKAISDVKWFLVAWGFLPCPTWTQIEQEYQKAEQKHGMRFPRPTELIEGLREEQERLDSE